MPEDLIREVEAAAILGVSHQRVNQLRAEGKLVVVQASGIGHNAEGSRGPVLAHASGGDVSFLDGKRS